MPDGRDHATVKLVGRISEIDAAAWDACAGTDNPFVGHAFLAALEDSGSVGRDTGWQPRHLVVADPAGAVVACAPMYLKSHSYGEYVFDHGWAAAYERAGGRYYPKLQVAVPFTPVPGPRLLARPGPGAEAARRTLIDGMIAAAGQLGVSSLHVTFPDDADSRRLAAAGLLMRSGYQFHWSNRGYGDFDDFLASLSARKRKTIRKERRAVADSGLGVTRRSGDDLGPEHWDAFHRCYVATGGQKWGQPYLTRAFFHQIGATMADRILLVLAEARGRIVAGALNLLGADALYGRNWGCLEDHPFLHFEACYYQAVEFAIERGLARVEAGAQGEHKVQRGYLPVATHSAHWIADRGFAAAVADFLGREGTMVEHERGALAGLSPFRRAADAG